MNKVLIGLPSYDGRACTGTFFSILQANKKGSENEIILRTADCSSLTRVFNNLWVMALDERDNGLTHFAMVHDDVIPEPFWLDKMLDIMNDKKADVLSAIIPIKTVQGKTSTAFDIKNGDSVFEHYQIRNLTLKEAYKMEPTFTAQNLLINTGLMLVDMRKDWVKEIVFRFEDDILSINGQRDRKSVV